MDFGQCTDAEQLSRIRFELPDLNSNEETFQLERLKRASARSPGEFRLFLGLSIWNHTPWIGNFYPETADAKQLLQAYQAQLNSIELNSTFYGVPEASLVERWKSQVSPEFRFCPKFPKSVSHSLNATHRDFALFIERMGSLGDRLGASFIQLPEHISPRDETKLRNLFSAVPKELKAMVEFRNQGFFQNQRLKPEWINCLAEYRLGSVITDTPLERDVAHVSLSATRTLIRFLGGNLHHTNEGRLKAWAKRLALWGKAGLKEAYFFNHEPDNGLAPEAAKMMIDLVRAEFAEHGIPVKLPTIHWHQLL